MTNHPNRYRTYWQKFPRGFANEYIVGVATSRASAEQYAAEGYVRINRATALRDLCYRGDAATESYVCASLDGNEDQDRFDLARRLRGAA